MTHIEAKTSSNKNTSQIHLFNKSWKLSLSVFLEEQNEQNRTASRIIDFKMKSPNKARNLLPPLFIVLFVFKKLQFPHLQLMSIRSGESCVGIMNKIKKMLMSSQTLALQFVRSQLPILRDKGQIRQKIVSLQIMWSCTPILPFVPQNCLIKFCVWNSSTYL